VRKTHDLIGMKRTVKTETRLSLSYWVRLERITRLWAAYCVSLGMFIVHWYNLCSILKYRVDISEGLNFSVYLVILVN